MQSLSSFNRVKSFLTDTDTHFDTSIIEGPELGIFFIGLQDYSISVVSLSEGPSYRILGFVCFVLLLPFLFVIFILETRGIGEYVYPILFPIFLGIGVFIVVLFAVIIAAVRCVTNPDSSTKWTKWQYTSHTSGTRPTASRPVFQIPMNCPSCQREIELDRVEWRDRLTIVCSGCFTDIQVESSH